MPLRTYRIKITCKKFPKSCVTVTSASHSRHDNPNYVGAKANIFHFHKLFQGRYLLLAMAIWAKLEFESLRRVVLFQNKFMLCTRWPEWQTEGLYFYDVLTISQLHPRRNNSNKILTFDIREQFDSIISITRPPPPPRINIQRLI